MENRFFTWNLRAKGLLNLLTQPVGIDHHPFDATPRQRIQSPAHQGFAPHLQKWFGASVRQGPHTCAAPGGEDNGLGFDGHRAIIDGQKKTTSKVVSSEAQGAQKRDQWKVKVIT